MDCFKLGSEILYQIAHIGIVYCSYNKENCNEDAQ